MSLPPDSAKFPPTSFHAEPLLAVACPTCFGAIAVGPSLLGQPADCPLCGRGFLVPMVAVADAAIPRAPDASPPAPPSHGRQDPPRDHRRARPREESPASVRPTPAPVEPPAEDSPAGSQPASAPMAELQFQEPVRTIVSGDQLITLRRLSPEEKASRRTRRNLVMMLAGVSILLAIVLLLGTKRPKRRNT